MAFPITIGSGFQVGRADRPDPKLENSFISFNANFTTDADVTIDFSSARANMSFTVPRSMFIDNGSNPSEVEVSVSQTDQFFTVPPFAQGIFKIDAQTQSVIRLVTVGGATDISTVTFYNYEVNPSVWYRFGTFNTNKPIQVEGAMDDGALIATEAANNPVYIGGKNYTNGLFRAVAVDDQGRLNFASNITVGGVFGDSPSGAADNGSAPVKIGAVFTTVPTTYTNGQRGNLSINGFGALRVTFTNSAGNSSVLGSVNTDYAGSQTGLLGMNVAMGILDDTSPVAIAEDRAGYIRMTADRSMMVSYRSATGSNSSVAGTVTANTTVLAPNNLRKGAVIYNNNTAVSGVILYVSLSSTCSTSIFSYAIQPQGTLEVPFGYVGIITCVFSSATGNAQITEMI